MGPRREETDRRGWKAGLLLALLLGSGFGIAAPTAVAEVPGRVPKPTIEKGKGGQCVEDTEFMRRNHMSLLLHQRDRTVHDGIRTKRYSLNGCIECHASRQTGSVIGSDANFCQTCHTYAAVKLDCFECHASKPRTAPSATGRRDTPSGVVASAAPLAPPAAGASSGVGIR